MGTTILSFEDRVVIETLHHEKHSLQYIADYLGFRSCHYLIKMRHPNNGVAHFCLQCGDKWAGNKISE